MSCLNDNPPDPRRTVFVVDEEGDSGKSEMAKNTRCLFPNKSVFCVPPQHHESMASLAPDDGADTAISDCPRQKQCDIPCNFLEDPKSGSTVQTKCEVTKKEFTTPHAVVLMNRNPETGKTDRCVIVETKLEPEERTKTDSNRESSTPSHIAAHLSRTREILDSCEEERRANELVMMMMVLSALTMVSSQMAGRRR